MTGIYTVLARKWRPLSFEDVVGQDVVVRTLGNAIRRDRVAHAYLFAGSRGTGKTTVARILARALNCENGPTPEPCGKCPSCVEILQGNSLAVLEIDGASTRGIDDIRRLREDVKLAPATGRKKIYIVDEVHMLTTQAFNALLKTLEEPPAHVVFVLATTDPQKLPETILSRCQRYNFARINVQDSVERLRTVMAGEKVELTDGALMLLARRSGGALRDALGFLDQVMAAGTSPVDEAAVAEALGLVGSDAYVDLVQSFVDRDAGRSLEILWNVHRNGHDLEFFVQGLLDLLRNLLIIQTAPQSRQILEVSTDEAVRLEQLGAPLSLGDLLRMIRITVEASDQIRRSDYPWIHLEMAVVEMASLDRVEDISEVLNELRRISGAGVPGGQTASAGPGPLERGGSTAPPQRRTPAVPRPAAGPERPPVASSADGIASSTSSDTGGSPATAPRGGAAAATLGGTPGLAEVMALTPAAEATPVAVDGADPWGGLLDLVRDESKLLWSVLSQGEPAPLDGQVLRFRIDPNHGFHIEQLREPAHQQLIERCIERAYRKSLGFEVVLEKGVVGRDDAGGKRRRAGEDPFVKKLLEYLDGEIVE